MEEKYEIVFICYLADYYWQVEEGLSIQEASEKVDALNRKEKIHKHNGCCNYIVQKQT